MMLSNATIVNREMALLLFIVPEILIERLTHTGIDLPMLMPST